MNKDKLQSLLKYKEKQQDLLAKAKAGDVSPKRKIGLRHYVEYLQTEIEKVSKTISRMQMEG